MKFTDIVSMSLLAIRRQKTRTALSLIGVVIGSLMLLFALASRSGVQEAVMRVFSMSKQLRQIHVTQNWSVDEKLIPAEELEVDRDLDEALRARLRKMLILHWQREHGGERIGLTQERIEKIESIQHVQNIHPQMSASVTLIQGDKELQGYGASVSADEEMLHERILVGKAFESDSEPVILLNEFVAWKWGFVSQSQMQKLIGTRVRIEHRLGAEGVAYSLSRRSGGDVEFSREELTALNSALDRIPTLIEELPLPEQERAALKKAFQTTPADPDSRSEPIERIIAQEYTIAGIYRSPTESETNDHMSLGRTDGFADFLLPIKTATQFALRVPHIRKNGFYQATVLVDHESHLKAVSKQIREMGLREYSLISMVEFIQEQVRQVTLIVSLVAIFALIISAVGIANTMVMSVVERTREIGIMKALGAREGQIQMLFLIEGALIGLIGGLCAMAIGLAIKIPIESYTISLLEKQLNKTFEQQHVIEFPLWLLALVLAFSMIVTTLATILPARRAARIDPITALRHD
ncbi:ABC transporter permease [Gimesia maris]|uniref:ABC transporter permease YtrF n=1 Tax=Gimesia maris TaxID=122 RepID=A0ABX5YQP5_9PLAN|nr:FtsX-like permease family protein [Gimesia maris]EDL60336.1 Predicted permease [Gimesia maris DSM 8797]QEG17895.1 ABC transporter permease YtrF precursor [Gimesia maris]QGQ29075.1 ABC transporter permease [Gimesia maris]